MCVQLEMCVLMQSVSLYSGNGMTTKFSRFYLLWWKIESIWQRITCNEHENTFMDFATFNITFSILVGLIVWWTFGQV